MRLAEWWQERIAKREKPITELAYPEEAPDYTRTVGNTMIESVLWKWFLEYKVPLEYRDFWRNAIVIKITDDIAYPALTYDGPDGKRHLEVKPSYCNAGVLGHEQAHNSYALLSNIEKQDFSSLWQAMKLTDRKIVYLVSVRPYALTSDVEGHAENYRYWGPDMPPVLKAYYPKLFEVTK